MKIKKNKIKERGGKASGSGKLFFLLHNIISMPLFFAIVLKMNLTEMVPTTLNALVSLEFLKFFLIILLIGYIIGFISRLFAYGLLFFYYNWDNPKIQKKSREIQPFLYLLNEGTCGFFSYPYLILMLLSTIAFTLSVASLIQQKIFGNDSFLAVIVSYTIIKLIIGAYIYLKYK